MSDKLEKAIVRVKQLPEDQQDVIVEEIYDEARWDAAFASSHDLLERRAAQATEEERQGLAQELDPDAP